MNRKTLQICGALLLCALAPTAFADDTKAGRGGGDSLRDVTYGSLSFAYTKLKLDNVGALTNIGFATGFRVPTIEWIGAEIAGSATIIPGKVSEVQPGSPGSPTGCGPLGLQPCPGSAASSSDSDASTFDMGVYAVLRSPGRFYAAGRVGWRYFQSSVDTNDERLHDQRSGAAFGGGVGWRWGQTLSGVELNYTRISKDLDQVSLGIVYGFGGGGAFY